MRRTRLSERRVSREGQESRGEHSHAPFVNRSLQTSLARISADFERAEEILKDALQATKRGKGTEEEAGREGEGAGERGSQGDEASRGTAGSPPANTRTLWRTLTYADVC